MYLSKGFIFLLLGLLICLHGNAQVKLSGSVVDAADNQKLEKAVVVLLNAADSILVKFSRVKENGGFVINSVDSGTYKLVISYPQYADYVEDVLISNANIHLGNVKLSKAALLLDEIEVVGKIPVIIKGDTIEYNADSFKVDKDAKVEDLLKVLPGITIDATGKITAQGKEVKKVLLDGEEFFGDDPTLITKNIRSDMVNKVQVYEKKSEMTDRTGVDDGERTQTIDILLKEDKKKGMFGQAVVGGGNNSYYGSKLMANRFKGSQKIAAYGIVANDGMVGLGFEDNQKYGGDNANLSMSDGGGIMISSNSDGDEGSSWDGRYQGNGVPRALNLGASYSDKSTNDKHKVNVSYKRNQMDVVNNSTYFSQNNLPNQARIDNSKSITNSYNKSDIANIRYDYKIDSLTDMTLRIGYRRRNGEYRSDTQGDQQTLDEVMINETNTRNNSLSVNENISTDVLMTRKFKKQRRSMTWNINYNHQNNDGTSNFYSKTDFLTIDSMVIDQLKNNVSANNNFATSLVYSEPFGKYFTGSVGYTFSNNTSSARNESFDKDPTTGLYTILDQEVLNDYGTSRLNNSIRTALNFKNEKFTMNFSNFVDMENLERKYNTFAQTLRRNQVSFRPQLNINYQITKSKSISFRYNGGTLQPALTQIEPLKQNEQQLITYLDNPDLSTGFRNSYSVNFNVYKPLKDRGMYIYTSATQMINPISSKVTLYEESGKQDISYVNVDRENWSMYGGGGYRFPLFKKMGVSMNLGLNGQYNNNYNYLALSTGVSELNNSESYSVSPSIGWSRYKANKMDFYVSLSPGFERLNSSLQPNLNSTTFIINTYGEFTYYFPKDFKININANQRHRSATTTLQAFDLFNTNGYISKKFLKDKALETQLYVNDILNKNNGIQRYQSGYSFVQSSNDVLRRYFMIKLIYNFTTMKGN